MQQQYNENYIKVQHDESTVIIVLLYTSHTSWNYQLILICLYIKENEVLNSDLHTCALETPCKTFSEFLTKHTVFDQIEARASICLESTPDPASIRDRRLFETGLYCFNERAYLGKSKGSHVLKHNVPVTGIFFIINFT